MATKRPLLIAVAGNPNSGKTTFFNSITGSSLHVGNYPGVTVEKTVGRTVFKGRSIELVDLPGTYSLSPSSEDELIARDHLVRERPDVVIQVVDASNLERNLYLSVQLMELGVPLVLAVNMMDAAEKKGLKIDTVCLSRLFGCPVIGCVASRGKGVEEVIAAAIDVVDKDDSPQNRVRYGNDLEQEIRRVLETLGKDAEKLKPYPPRWTAVHLLEGDGELTDFAKRKLGEDHAVFGAVELCVKHIRDTYSDADPASVFANARYGFISGALRECIAREAVSLRDRTEQIDDILTHRWLGLPIFFFFVWILFKATFVLGEIPVEMIEKFFGWTGGLLQSVLPPSLLTSLLIDGLIAGVGGVLAFIPNIVILFLGIALLEDTGYMARIAFLMDRLMHRLGLHGKSFIPLMIGFGCSVPAIMATRTLEHKKSRLVTMAAIPFMSCSAKLPVYVLLISAFFPSHRGGSVMFGIYALGILIAAGTAYLFSKFVYPDDPVPFVMELPPYHSPTLKGLWIHAWRRTWMFIRKAFTVILAASMVLWALSNFPRPSDEEIKRAAELNPKMSEAAFRLEYSAAGRIGKAIEPVIRPLGFDWKVGVALLAGFAAKEVVVSAMSTVYSMESSDGDIKGLREALVRDPNFNPLVALSLMVFILLYVPCISAMVVMHKESGSGIFALGMVIYTTVVAWLFSFAVYKISLFLVG